MDKIRLSKLLAHRGICSRRQAVEYIKQGRVAINDITITDVTVFCENPDLVKVDGAPLPQAQKCRVFKFHKPKGVLTSDFDPQGRALVYDLLPKDLPRVVSVGRLDYNSEGLLLLTTCGEFKRSLELPAKKMKRHYRVRLYGHPNNRDMTLITKGLNIDGIQYTVHSAKLQSQQGGNAWLEFVLQEGKNREIRKICEHFGWQVNRLIRTQYGSVKLSNLPKKGLYELSQLEIEQLKTGQSGYKKGWAKPKKK